jgi:beta-phosphoglucomutase
MTAFGVLFDMDGVLVNSASLHMRAYEQVFERVGLPFTEAAREAVRSGKPRAEVLDLALPAAEQSLKKELTRAKPEALRRLLEGRADYGMPGAIESVQALSRAGVPMAVVTNSRTPELWLDKLDISELIRVVVSGDDVSSPKPSPEGYLLGAKRLGLSPDRCLAVEDSLDGWTAAQAAGMEVAVVAKERPVWLDADTQLMDQLDAERILRLLDLILAAHP